MENTNFTRKPTQDNFVTEKVDIFKNNLLGEYDDEGHYDIAPQIVNELLELKKYRQKSYDNSMFCSGLLLGYGEIIFEIKYEKEKDEQGNAKASLYVLEEVDKINGYMQNVLRTKIAEFASNDDDFIEESYRRFNVTNESDEGDDEGQEKKSLEDFSLDDSFILAKKAYMLLLHKLSKEKVLDAYGKYFTARLATLTKLNNEFSNAVLTNFNQKYDMIDDIFLKEKNYKALNELLDACIEGVSGTKEIYKNQEENFNGLMADSLENFTENINKLSDKVEQKAINMLEPEDRKKVHQMNKSLEHDEKSQEMPEEREDDSLGIDESFTHPVLEDESEKTTNVAENVENAQRNSSIVDQIMKMQSELKAHAENNASAVSDDISKDYADSNATFQKMRQTDRLSTIQNRLNRIQETDEVSMYETNNDDNNDDNNGDSDPVEKQDKDTLFRDSEQASNSSENSFSNLFTYLKHGQEEKEETEETKEETEDQKQEEKAEKEPENKDMSPSDAEELRKIRELFDMDRDM